MNKIVTVTINDTVSQSTEVKTVTVVDDATLTEVHDFVVEHLGGRPTGRRK